MLKEYCDIECKGRKEIKGGEAAECSLSRCMWTSPAKLQLIFAGMG